MDAQAAEPKRAERPKVAPASATYSTPEQVACSLQISVRSVYRMAAKHADMPALRLDGALRFNRERLERWLRDREQGRPQRKLAIVKTEAAR